MYGGNDTVVIVPVILVVLVKSMVMVAMPDACVVKAAWMAHDQPISS